MTTPLEPWRPANNGSGKRIWFVCRRVTDHPRGMPLEYHESVTGDLIRYASMEGAQVAADVLNEQGGWCRWCQREHQPRENPVPCKWCGRRTMDPHATCEQDACQRAETTYLSSLIDPSTDPVDEPVVCLGCYATREPGDEDRDCACVLGGFDAPAGEGILDPDHAYEWVRKSDLSPTDQRMVF